MSADAKQEVRHDFLNKFGKARAELEDEIDKANEEFKSRAEDPSELQKYKVKFLAIDTDGSGDLNEMEILTFLNSTGIKDNGKIWTEPKIKEKIIAKHDNTGKGKLRYHGFLSWILGDEMGVVLRLKMKFEKLAAEAGASPSGPPPPPKKLW